MRETHIPFDINQGRIILQDYVIITGRTIRPVMVALVDIGRPAVIRLLVLLYRGGREFPIQPDWTGRFIETTEDEAIKVSFREEHGKDEVIRKRKEEG